MRTVYSNIRTVYPSKNHVTTHPDLMTLKVLPENRKWTQVLKNISLENGLIKLYCVWFYMVTLNKTHATILVCAVDDFRKYQKMQKLRFFGKKNP